MMNLTSKKIHLKAALLTTTVLASICGGILIANTSSAQASSKDWGLPAIAETKLGYLNANDPRSRINIRSGPSTSSRPLHYGLPGDAVEVIRSTTSSDGYVWYFVRFHTSGATGWVREDLIMIDPGHGCHFRVQWGGGGFHCT